MVLVVAKHYHEEYFKSQKIQKYNVYRTLGHTIPV